MSLFVSTTPGVKRLSSCCIPKCVGLSSPPPSSLSGVVGGQIEFESQLFPKRVSTRVPNFLPSGLFRIEVWLILSKVAVKGDFGV